MAENNEFLCGRIVVYSITDLKVVYSKSTLIDNHNCFLTEQVSSMENITAKERS